MRIFAVRTAIAVAICLFTMQSASAQTAEETVAYLFFQMENGASINRKPDSPKAVQESVSPAKYSSVFNEDNVKKYVGTTVTKIDSCNYEIVSHTKEDGIVIAQGTIKADFNNSMNFQRIGEGGPHAYLLVGTGACTFKERYQYRSSNSEEKCSDRWRLPMTTDASVERAKGALAYLRNVYCKGRAF